MVSPVLSGVERDRFCPWRVMLRLKPPRRELLRETPRLDAWVVGTTANVATQLARLDHGVGIAVMVPDHDLGRAAISRCGVTVSTCRSSNMVADG